MNNNKTLRLLFAKCVFIASGLTANAQSYYPLQVGNKWYFESDSIEAFAVVADTLMVDGHQYYTLDKKDINELLYVRADSFYVYYYVDGREIPFFHLTSQIGDTTNVALRPYAYTELIAVDTIHWPWPPIDTRVLTYKLDGLAYKEVQFSDILGPFHVAWYDDPPAPWPSFFKFLRACEIDGKIYSTAVSVDEVIAPQFSFHLLPNFPNPFNAETEIQYVLSGQTSVQIALINSLGQVVRVMNPGKQSPGLHSVRWDGKDALGVTVSSGLYYYVVSTSVGIKAGKALFVK